MQKLLQRETISARMLAALMALVLALGLMPITHNQAWAASPFAVTASDTEIAASDVVLTANGYTYTDSEYAPENPSADGYGYISVSKTVDLYTVTVPSGTTQVSLNYGSSEYLTYVYNAAGEYVSGYYEDPTKGETSTTVNVLDNSGNIAYARIQDPYNSDWTGGALQFAITWSISSDSDDPEPTPTPDPETPASTAGSYTADKASALISNLTARFAQGGADAGITNMTAPAALALHAEGMSASLDGEAIADALANSEATDAYFSVGTLAKYVLALNAAGVDCTAVNVGGTTRNLIDELVEGIGDGTAVNSWSAVYLLPALDAVAPNQTNLINKMIDAITSNQTSEGFFGADYGSEWAASQVTAQAIMALAGHGQDAALAKAKSALLTRQLSDGGFADNQGDTTSNLEASCAVVYALSSLGVDVSTVKSATGSTPLDYIVAEADADLAGYNDNTSGSELNSAAEALLALVSYQGMVRTGGAFNAYADAYATSSPSDSTTNSNGATKTAQTGDSSNLALGFLIMMAVSSAFAMAAARRKMQE